MTRERTDTGVRPDRSLSRRLLVFAVAASVVAVVGGQWLVWSVYSTTADTQPAASAQTSAEPLVVGVGRTPGGPAEWATYARAFAQVGRDLGRPIVVRYATARGDTQEDILEKKVDVAMVSVVEYLELRDAGAAVLVATPVVGGESLDQAILVSATDTSRSKLASDTVLVTQGSLASEAYAHWLRDRREPADRPVKSITLGATQDANLEALLAGRVQRTGVNRSAISAWPSGTFEVEAASPEFGMAPVVARTDLDPQVLAAVRKSLVSMAQRQRLPRDGRVTGFIDADAAAYDFADELRSWLPDRSSDDDESEAR